MHWQQQVCSSYSCVLQILHSLYHGKSFIWQHVHTHPYFFDSVMFLLSWTLLFVISLASSPWGWDHFCPSISTMNGIFHHIFFLYKWCYLCMFVICMIFLYLCFLWFSSTEYVIFSISTFAFFVEISAKLYTWTIYRYMIYYCVIFCEHILLYKCYILSWDIFSVLAHLFLLSS